VLERTFLYGVLLLGAGTAFVESLRSYIQRLAFTHNVKPRSLIETLLRRYPLEAGVTDLSPIVKFWDVHANGALGKAIQERLERATRVDLSEGTIGALCELVAGQHLVDVGDGRYCPLCVQEGATPYGQLLWEVSFVHACPKHRVRLREASRCGAPSHQHLPVNCRPRLPHVCSACGSVGFACVQETPESADEAEVWVAGQVGQLLARREYASDGWSPESLQRGLRELVNARFGGSVVSASLSSGLARGSVSTWVRGKFRPNLAGLMQLCYLSKADIGALLAGEFAPAPGEHSSSSALWPQSRNSVDLMQRSYQVCEASTEEQRLALERAHAVTPPQSLHQVARSLGTSKRMLRHRFPALSRSLTERVDAHRLEREKAKFQAALNAYSEAAMRLRSRGSPVSSGLVQKESKLVAFGRNPSRVRALTAVLNKFADAA
jgi:TniQ protein